MRVTTFCQVIYLPISTYRAVALAAVRTRPRRARRWYHGSVGRAAPAWTSKISIGLRNSNHTDSLGYLHDGTIKAVHKGNGALRSSSPLHLPHRAHDDR